MILLRAIDAVLSALLWLAEALIESMAAPLIAVALAAVLFLALWRVLARRAAIARASKRQ
jgi:hypothetical protein